MCIYIYQLSLTLTNFIKSKKVLLSITFWKYEVPRLLEGGAYFQFVKINNAKWENLQIFTYNKPHIINILNVNNIFIFFLFGS